MTVITFDTLKFVETLREAGVPDRHAKAISQAVRDTHETAELATGRDLRETGAAIRSELQTLGTSLASDIQASRSESKSEMQELKANMQTLEAETKFNMQALGSELRSEIQALRSETRALEPRLTIRLGGIVVVALGAFTALSKWIA